MNQSICNNLKNSFHSLEAFRPLLSVMFFSSIWSASLNKRMSHRLVVSMILMFSLTVVTLYIFLSNLSRSVCIWSMFNKSTRHFTPPQLLIWNYKSIKMSFIGITFLLFMLKLSDRKGGFLSKILIYEFWYDCVKPKYAKKVKLCYKKNKKWLD